MFAIFLQLTLFIFIFPVTFKFELRVSEIVGKKYQKIDIHVTQPCLRTHIQNGNDFWMSWLGDTTRNMRRYISKILINAILFHKFWNLYICHVIIHRGHKKSLERFRTSCHVWCIETRQSSKKFHRDMSEEAWVGVDLTFIFEFDFKTFSVGTAPYRLCRVQV
jgi:hypothetical protein